MNIQRQGPNNNFGETFCVLEGEFLNVLFGDWEDKVVEVVIEFKIKSFEDNVKLSNMLISKVS